MFLRLLLESFLRQRRRKALAGAAILLGTTAITAMLALATTIGDRIHKELAVYGANIVITPKADQLSVKIGGIDIKPATGGAYLHESDLAKLKTIFWANNITGISPVLQTSANAVLGSNQPPIRIPVQGIWTDHPFGSGTTGAEALHPWWKLTPAYPADEYPWTTWHGGEVPVLLGARLAKKLNVSSFSRFKLRTEMTSTNPDERPSVVVVRAILSTGDETEDTLLMDLQSAQALAGLPDAVSRVEVAARTKPEDAFARADPDTLPAKQREIWYCRPYANSIAYQIREAIPGAAAEQVRQVEQTEGTVLARISGLMWFIASAALLAAGFAVSAAMATAVLERRAEIGLMRSLGASKSAIALLFYAETGILALIAGSLGYLLGSALAAWLGARIFSGEAALTHAFNPVLLPVTVATALLIALAGSTPSIRAALRMDPSAVLRADA